MKKALASSSQISAIHKANVMQKTEGLFLKGSHEVAEEYPEINFKISERGIALIEVVHGSAPDIARKNFANPTALLLSGVLILCHLNLHDKADQIQNAILNTIAEGEYRTTDLGGKAKTTKFTNTIIDHL
ncbi:isocitrate dehydrogenase [NAD] catalytic subunit 5, mitochondrial-like [Arachis stenosperma]|uniref:isocitrate dehydrogenase [NAD] catalytic subunit 5, mitochondrial-like n=1 Tax=Arachis stenosperma TaxID=217475 RepID=UPI0025AC7168|nr:isocitrate dehydrogenase [NAD] catalytic subunit 5, mitochondrial-like [Arachis stenosperma]